MKPRFNRSSPVSKGYTGGSSRSVGNLTPTKATEWKPLSKATIIEFAVEGKLSVDYLRKAFDQGKLTIRQFKQGFWATFQGPPTPADLVVINQFHQWLF